MCQVDSTQPTSDIFWRPGQDVSRVHGTGVDIHRPDVYDVVDVTVDALSGDLRKLSLDIHGASFCSPSAKCGSLCEECGRM